MKYRILLGWIFIILAGALFPTMQAQQPIEKDVWTACWNATQGYFDFTVDAWTRLSTSKQFEYATAYQGWYANWKNLPIEKTFKAGGVELVMRLIPPGKFWMGSPKEEKGREEYEAIHRVLLTKAFYIGKYEVTQGQWQTVMGTNPSKFNEVGRNGPVDKVSWNDCQDFCKKTEMRLPTEAEWEYVCRGGVMARYCFGDNEADLVERGWYFRNSESKTHPVGEKKANSFGVHDMHGNLLETCADYCDCEMLIVTDTYKDDITDPLCQNGPYRILRGGSWALYGSYCRSAFRTFQHPDAKYKDMGLRVVASIP